MSHSKDQRNTAVCRPCYVNQIVPAEKAAPLWAVVWSMKKREETLSKRTTFVGWRGGAPGEISDWHRWFHFGREPLPPDQKANTFVGSRHILPDGWKQKMKKALRIGKAAFGESPQPKRSLYSLLNQAWLYGPPPILLTDDDDDDPEDDSL